MSYSIVIPAHDARVTLGAVLDALDQQHGAPEHEVIVVDDGSSDGTHAWLTRQARPGVRVASQPRRGPAAARNRGIDLASGTRVAFLGADVIPSPGWLAAHDAAHARRGRAQEVAVLGYTSWHPSMPRTRFLRFLNERGPQFGYELITRPEAVAPGFFYASNLSIGRSWLVEERFDERFTSAAVEDVELAIRLDRRGLRLVFEPAAVASHLHPMDLTAALTRAREVGRACALLHRLHPDLARTWRWRLGWLVPRPTSPLARTLQRLAVRLESRPVDIAWIWRFLYTVHLRAGLREGRRHEATP